MQTQSCSSGQCSVSSLGGDSCSSGCCSGSSSSCCSTSSASYVSKLLCGAECAKKSLMVDKMKAKLEARIGKKMDKAADLAIDLFLQKMEVKINGGEKCQEAEAKLHQIFSVK